MSAFVPNYVFREKPTCQKEKPLWMQKGLQNQWTATIPASDVISTISSYLYYPHFYLSIPSVQNDYL